jgi:hypothetical protein
VVVVDLGEHQMMLNQVDLVVVEVKHHLVEHQELLVKDMLEVQLQLLMVLAGVAVLEVLAQHQPLVVWV